MVVRSAAWPSRVQSRCRPQREHCESTSWHTTRRDDAAAVRRRGAAVPRYEKERPGRKAARAVPLAESDTPLPPSVALSRHCSA